MAKKYRSYSKKEFEFKIREIYRINNLFCKLVDVTERVGEIVPVYEHVYSVPTKSSAVALLIYSSVDIRNARTREIGSDAVRIVMQWTIKKRNDEGQVIATKRVYRKVAKHLRIDTLFQNLEKTILSNYSTTDLKYKEFTAEKDFFTSLS